MSSEVRTSRGRCSSSFVEVEEVENPEVEVLGESGS